MSRRANPVFTSIENEQQNYVNEGFDEFAKTNCATYGGITLKTAILIAIAILSGIGACALAINGQFGVLVALMFVSAITSFICVFIGTRNPGAAMPCAIIYSAGEGISLGLLVALCNIAFPGIVPAAIGILSVILITMLVLFRMGIVKPSSRLKAIVMTALISFIFISLVGSIMSLAGSTFINDTFFGNGVIAIILALVLVIVGAIMLVFDFEAATQIVESQADKRYEWCVSLGLMVSLVYLFIQIIRLLIIISSRSRD